MFNLLTQPENLVAIAIVIGVLATFATVVLPMMGGDNLNSRMKSVALEREQLRVRERTRMADEKNQVKRAMRNEPTAVVKSFVDKLNLRTALADEQTTASLVQAGFRGQSPLFIFLASRAALPVLFFGATMFYLFFIAENDYTNMQRTLGSLLSAGLGFYLPILVVNNIKSKRQLSITMAWPDALDLCLICVESGMSIEASFRRVATEIGGQSIALAEELMLTTSELSFLQERRMAYENLTQRTGLETVKNVTLALVQAEKYGTPLSSALRVLSQENRDQRMAKAEKKAASLPPKLTVPMMVCFLPVLFCVILGPAAITAFAKF